MKKDGVAILTVDDLHVVRLSSTKLLPRIPRRTLHVVLLDISSFTSIGFQHTCTRCSVKRAVSSGQFVFADCSSMTSPAVSEYYVKESVLTDLISRLVTWAWPRQFGLDFVSYEEPSAAEAEASLPTPPRPRRRRQEAGQTVYLRGRL